MTKPRPEPYSQSSAAGWFTVFVLVAAYAVSNLDRQVVGLLVEPLRRDLGVTNTEIGLLQGPAFGLFYALAGIPLGLLADRTHRVRMIAFGVAFWSLMTLCCGLADNFTALFLARMGVGVGEASLVPAAVSLLADTFRADRRALPMSVFTSGTTLGNGLALALGGVFVAFAASGVEALPLLGPWLAVQRNWQTVFILAGLIGMPVALLVLVIGEPARARAAGATHPKLSEIVAYLKANWALFLPLLGACGIMYMTSNSLTAWGPTLFVRKFGWAPSEVGMRLGVLVMPIAVSGSVLSGVLATWLMRRGYVDGPLRAMRIASALLLPLSVLGPLAPTEGLAMAGVLGMYFSVALTFGVATATFVAVTPSRLRGQIAALYLLIGNGVGLGLGPPIVGALLDSLPGGPEKIGAALSIVGACSMIPGVILLWLAQRRYAGQTAVIEASLR